MKVKICGITDIGTLSLIVKNKINFAGFIFHENSPRNVTSAFLSQVEKFDFNQTRPVCVFVNSERSYINSALKFFNNPIIQFHGDESIDFCESFECEFWKVLRVKDSKSFEDIKYFKSANAILLDTYKDGTYGGTGITFDWSFIPSDLNFQNKLVLSGGLTVENIKSAININPWCLDLNSGVESSPGLKDHLKITEILSLIRKNEK